jgi:WD40 repeat protein
VALSPLGQFLASGSADRTVKVWGHYGGTREEKSQATLREHHHELLAVAFFGGEARVVSVDRSGLVVVWAWGQARVADRFLPGGLEAPLTAAGFSPGGGLVALAGRNKQIKVFDVSSKNEVATLTGHSDFVLSMSFAADGRSLASAGGLARRSGEAILWELPAGKLIHSASDRTGPTTCVALSADGKRFATAGYEGAVTLWDAATGQAVRTLPGPRDWVTSLVIDPTGRVLVAGRGDGSLHYWDLNEGKLMVEIKRGHEDLITALAVGDRAANLATASLDQRVCYWGVSWDEKGRLWITVGENL